MKWTIAFDAGCDIRDIPTVEGVDLVLVPLKILLGDGEVTDDGSVPMAELQRQLDGAAGKTGTACPSVGDWHHIMEDSDRLIAITLSGAVSGSYQSACIARDMVLEEQPGKALWVMDSVSGSGTMEFLVRKAVEGIQSGLSFNAVCDSLRRSRSEAEIFFLLQNVDNLMSNGRLNPLLGRAVKALKMCMLGTVSPEGTMEVIGKVRGFDKLMDKCLDTCAARGCTAPRAAIISHCLNPQGAEQLKAKLEARFPGVAVEIRETGLICGYYAEKGGLIVALQR